MDPELMEGICICPSGCSDGYLIVSIETGVLEECSRCNGEGYVPCEFLQEGELKYTLAQQRNEIRLVVNDDGSYSAVRRGDVES